MSNLSNVFRGFLKNNPDLNQAQLSKKLGIGPSHLTHILKGRRRGFGPKLLTGIILRISTKPDIQAQFLTAYLRDQFGPELQHLVDIDPSRFLEKTSAKERTKDCYEQLAAELRKIALDEDIVQCLLKLGKSARAKPALARVLDDLTKIQ